MNYKEIYESTSKNSLDEGLISDMLYYGGKGIMGTTHGIKSILDGSFNKEHRQNKINSLKKDIQNSKKERSIELEDLIEFSELFDELGDEYKLYGNDISSQIKKAARASFSDENKNDIVRYIKEFIKLDYAKKLTSIIDDDNNYQSHYSSKSKGVTEFLRDYAAGTIIKDEKPEEKKFSDIELVINVIGRIYDWISQYSQDEKGENGRAPRDSKADGMFNFLSLAHKDPSYSYNYSVFSGICTAINSEVGETKSTEEYYSLYQKYIARERLNCSELWLDLIQPGLKKSYHFAFNNIKNYIQTYYSHSDEVSDLKNIILQYTLLIRMSKIYSEIMNIIIPVYNTLQRKIKTFTDLSKQPNVTHVIIDNEEISSNQEVLKKLADLKSIDANFGKIFGKDYGLFSDTIRSQQISNRQLLKLESYFKSFMKTSATDENGDPVTHTAKDVYIEPTIYDEINMLSKEKGSLKSIALTSMENLESLRTLSGISSCIDDLKDVRGL